MLFYVITYDIPDDRRRKKVADLLEGYGQRVQYSVFECTLSKSKLQELQNRLRKIYQSEEDSLRFYPLSRHTLTQVDVWGEPPLTEAPGSVIV
ncbi:CRISPR-associated endonuclease Cas2 (plasmid) [Synechocystis sp. PCC 7339]|uniref:CRISPR-associated endonuclease Cas2 n=1 Tax=unclassified Synechocystis TaxID=2640012 RepID=UPI001BAFD5EF|nr:MULTISPECIES: CRISPR-associated endonuclease Cas2 [unclassified Synechocystis]QUS62535.1 CRISPR-associated endonuclease Cas2 [Synechocystis sp. PCC 7338]UAJ74651.1 CRISPR-associated endonuclease Cas2 [Synechocystis sp. PCC 7339]